MRLAIISDVHGNLPNLERTIKLINNQNKVDSFIFLGDVVGYGPWSNECVELVDSIKNSYKVLGNHEEYFINSKCKSKTGLTKLFFTHSVKNFKFLEKIKNYKKNIFLDNIKFTHTLMNKYIFYDTKIDIDIKENIVLGHSHKQFKKKINKFWIINPGSLGQNRENINVMNYAIIDTKSLKVEFFSKFSNIMYLINEMKSRGYPNECIEYYLKKIK